MADPDLPVDGKTQSYQDWLEELKESDPAMYARWAAFEDRERAKQMSLASRFRKWRSRFVAGNYWRGGLRLWLALVFQNWSNHGLAKGLYVTLRFKREIPKQEQKEREEDG